jgi:hypothetical protein
MTIEEMRQELHEFCEEQYECNSCELDGDTCRCGRGAYFIDFEPDEDGYMSSEEIAMAYLMVFGKKTTPKADEPHIKDSGSRTEFPSGAVRDMGGKDKGRCDLMPLDVVAIIVGEQDSNPDPIIASIGHFQTSGDTGCLYQALEHFAGKAFTRENMGTSCCHMCLEVSKHFAEGCEKYGENNWKKGIPVKSYINSGVRHYLKWLRGDKDENHHLAFCWNLMCALWTCKHKPELNDYGLKTCPVCGESLPREAKFCGNCQVTIVCEEENE